jgi:hypothetical protein
MALATAFVAKRVYEYIDSYLLQRGYQRYHLSPASGVGKGLSPENDSHGVIQFIKNFVTSTAKTTTTFATFKVNVWLIGVLLSMP